jgi:uncharacterized LabA/DUF88 family protein
MFRLRRLGWTEFFDVCHFARAVAGNRVLSRVCYFTARPSIPPIKTQTQYWNEVQHLQRVDKQILADFGQYVRYGYMVKHPNRWEEKKTDVWLAAQMVFDACGDVFDTLILVTADNDLVPAAELVRFTGKDVELISFPGSQGTSQLMQVVSLVRTARRSHFVPY